MFIIFGLIFNVNTKEGEKFLQSDQIQHELVDADKDLTEASKNLEFIKQKMEEYKNQVQQRYNCDDQA